MAKVALKKLHKAVKFAAKAHRKQDLDGTAPLPYLAHPIEVLSILRYEAEIVDEEVLCAAVLHDTLEESSTSAADLERGFGQRVADLVRQLTRQEPPTQNLTPEEIWRLRTITMLAEIDAMDAEAKTIKLADRASNLRVALVARKGEDRFRYVRQSQLILDRIPADLAPMLWQRVSNMAATIKLPKKIQLLTATSSA